MTLTQAFLLGASDEGLLHQQAALRVQKTAEDTYRLAWIARYIWRIEWLGFTRMVAGQKMRWTTSIVFAPTTALPICVLRRTH